MQSVPNWIERCPPEAEGRGSNPFGRANKSITCDLWLSSDESLSQLCTHLKARSWEVSESVKDVVDDFDKSLRQVQTIEHFGSTRESARGGRGVECLQSFFKR